jgi:hypothetical protein
LPAIIDILVMHDTTRLASAKARRAAQNLLRESKFALRAAQIALRVRPQHLVLRANRPARQAQEAAYAHIWGIAHP